MAETRLILPFGERHPEQYHHTRLHRPIEQGRRLTIECHHDPQDQ